MQHAMPLNEWMHENQRKTIKIKLFKAESVWSTSRCQLQQTFFSFSLCFCFFFFIFFFCGFGFNVCFWTRHERHIHTRFTLYVLLQSHHWKERNQTIFRQISVFDGLETFSHPKNKFTDMHSFSMIKSETKSIELVGSVLCASGDGKLNWNRFDKFDL